MKPLPVADERSKAYWDAAARHELAIQRCLHCERFHHPPVVVCDGCRSPQPEFRFEVVSGAAKLRTWTIIRRPFIPAFAPDAPWVMAVGELREQQGVLLLARLLDGLAARLRIGAALEVVFEDAAAGVTLPNFRLRESAQ